MADFGTAARGLVRQPARQRVGSEPKPSLSLAPSAAPPHYSRRAVAAALLPPVLSRASTRRPQCGVSLESDFPCEFVCVLGWIPALYRGRDHVMLWPQSSAAPTLLCTRARTHRHRYRHRRRHRHGLGHRHRHRHRQTTRIPCARTAVSAHTLRYQTVIMRDVLA